MNALDEKYEKILHSGLIKAKIRNLGTTFAISVQFGPTRYDGRFTLRKKFYSKSQNIKTVFKVPVLKSNIINIFSTSTKKWRQSHFQGYFNPCTIRNCQICYPPPTIHFIFKIKS